MKTIKLNSLSALTAVNNPEKANADKWQDFLKEKGHTADTFKILPDSLQLALKISFSKRVN